MLDVSGDGAADDIYMGRGAAAPFFGARSTEQDTLFVRDAGMWVLSSAAYERDSDGDGVADAFDNCVWTPNSDQLDSDSDNVGDACDDEEDSSVSDGMYFSDISSFVIG